MRKSLSQVYIKKKKMQALQILRRCKQRIDDLQFLAIEYVIDIIDTTISEYAEWLKDNHYISPLYLSCEQRKKEYEGYKEHFYGKI